MRTRTELINKLIQTNKYKTFLEIGTNTGHNFNAIIAEYKVSVDPDQSTPATYHETSDSFFDRNKEKFDIIFIDGLHEADQVYRDIVNALKFLNEGGAIVCHDMNPLSYAAQLVPRIQRVWNGDCWRAWVRFRQERSDLNMFVLNMDHGCGVITRGKQERLVTDLDETYDNLVDNREEWLNLKDPSYLREFLMS